MPAKRKPTPTSPDTDSFDRCLRLGTALTTSLNLPEVFNVIMEQMALLFNPANWSLLLLDEERQQLRFEIVVGKGTEILQGAWMPLDQGISGWVVRNGESVVVTDAAADPRVQREFDRRSGFTTTSVIAVPLSVHGRVQGVIELVNYLDDGALPPQQERLLRAFADFAAIAIDNARAMQRARELTVTDDVTSLYNARFLQQTLEQEYRRSRRYGTPFSLIFIDLDYFKHINDTHGHLVGSDVLRETATILRDNLRVTDIATRYGGDEFVLVLPETTQPEALVVAERCRDAVKQHVFGARHGAACRITASFGIATLPDDTADKMDLLRLADQAMYYVKEHNRDNIATAAVLKASENQA